MTDLIWVDLETGGYDSRRHDILELAAIRTSGDGSKVLGHLKALVLPRDLEAPAATEEALELGGFDRDRWEEDALPLREVLVAFARLAHGAVLSGHNVRFDRRFLVVASARCNVVIPTATGSSVDTMDLARPLKKSGEVDSVALGKLCAHFGIGTEGEHTAPVDVRNTVLLYRALRRRAEAGRARKAAQDRARDGRLTGQGTP